jgi:SagB-type dehydrogenase family enzyme
MAKSALEYHRQTSYDRYKMKGQGLDWANQPSVFKTYPGLKTVPLPRVKARSKENLSSVIREGSKANAAAKLTLDRLARIILLAHSVTAEVRHGDTQFYYRNVASAGALYPFELYVGARNISGLEHGLYHHSIGLHALTLLRPGNIMPALSSALERGKHSVPVLIFVLTSIFFRSSWKYRDRAYRYSLLDTGHLAENLSLALTAEELPWSLYYDFDDAMVNNLLGVDPLREGCLAVVCVWGEDVSDIGEPQDLKPSDQGLPDASRVSAREINYTLIRQIHTSSSRVVEAVQRAPMLDHLGLKMEPAKQISKADEWPEVMNYAEAVLRRRSRRNFVRWSCSVQPATRQELPD